MSNCARCRLAGLSRTPKCSGRCTRGCRGSPRHPAGAPSAAHAPAAHERPCLQDRGRAACTMHVVEAASPHEACRVYKHAHIICAPCPACHDAPACATMQSCAPARPAACTRERAISRRGSACSGLGVLGAHGASAAGCQSRCSPCRRACAEVRRDAGRRSMLVAHGRDFVSLLALAGRRAAQPAFATDALLSRCLDRSGRELPQGLPPDPRAPRCAAAAGVTGRRRAARADACRAAFGACDAPRGSCILCSPRAGRAEPGLPQRIRAVRRLQRSGNGLLTQA